MRPAVPALLLVLAAAPAGAACRDEAGPRRAAELLRHCGDVGAACRPTAACPTLVEAIRDGCGKLGSDAPNLCGLYVGEADEDDEDD